MKTTRDITTITNGAIPKMYYIAHEKWLCFIPKGKGAVNRKIVNGKVTYNGERYDVTAVRISIEHDEYMWLEDGRPMTAEEIEAINKQQ